MKNKIEIMLSMQDAMNTRVNPVWRDSNNEWYRAIWTECAEMLEHYGWKWWKHQEPDLNQVQLELIDIFHFAMSDYLLRESDYSVLAKNIANELGQNLESRETDFKNAIEQAAMNTIRDKTLSFSEFANLMKLGGLEFEQLYQLYVGKNVLNFFRQDHGYKDGSYQKIWLEREDNEHLSEILTTLNSDDEDFKDQVYQALEARYP
jgi:dimeric dUTPase (all-alpha-NTP-PPase superfamily)